MNWARRLRWQVAAVPVLAALAAMAVAALPAAAQTAGHPGPGTGPKVPVFKGIPGLTAGPRAPQQAAVLPLAGTTPAVAGTGDTTIPVVFDYAGSDSHDYEAPLASPTQAISLGGRMIGGPGEVFVAAPIGPGVAGPFVRGTDNALWLFGGFTTGGSPIWISLGGASTSRPGVAAGALSVSDGSGEAVDAVIRGTNGAVWDRELTSMSELPWRNLGGTAAAGSGPAAVNVGGTLYALLVGTNGAVWVNSSTDGAHWSGWKSLGGHGIGDIGVANPAPGVGVVFIRGTDNAIWYNEFVGTTAGVSPGWHSLGGKTTSGVGAGSAPDGSTSILMLGTDNHIWKRTGTWPTLGSWGKLF
jgi:hypothetical protein